jgi:hypothetical protein
MAEIGLPTGLRLLESPLRALVSQGTLSAWERRGSRLLLYFLRLPGGRTVIPLGLQAEAPMTASIPPSRFYEYYRPETSRTVVSGRFEVNPAPTPTLAPLASVGQLTQR